MGVDFRAVEPAVDSADATGNCAAAVASLVDRQDALADKSEPVELADVAVRGFLLKVDGDHMQAGAQLNATQCDGLVGRPAASFGDAKRSWHAHAVDQQVHAGAGR